MPLKDYQGRLQQALNALDTLNQMDETEDLAGYESRLAETTQAIRITLPEHSMIEWNNTAFSTDNSWLHHELVTLEQASQANRQEPLTRLRERLSAINEHLAEIEKATFVTPDKRESSSKLAEILKRPEYAREIRKETVLARLWKRLLEWLSSLFPTVKPLSPGGAGLFSRLAQIFVILLALGVLAYVFKILAPHFWRGKSGPRRQKSGPRIVLGEKLEPERSAPDLLAEAEALARRGDIRAAIRKTYIALLIELGQRKILSLAQHKTNRDYLRAIREIEPLYQNVNQLTESFERHWYGFAYATEEDWIAFRARYKQALSPL